MKIWIVAHDIDYEGMGYPEVAFTSEIKAKTYADKRSRAEKMNMKHERDRARPGELEPEE